MCVQKIGDKYVESVVYGCNNVIATIQGVTHNLDRLISYTESSCILSNNISTFELYIPSINIEEIKKCFSCSQKVTLDNILGGVGSIINSFNSNSNNSNSTVGNTNSLNGCCDGNCKELEVKEQLDRIEKEVHHRNHAEYSYLPLIFVLCLVLLGIIIVMIKTL